MTLREDLKNYIPKYLWEVLNHPEGYIISHEEFNAIWNMIREQGDQQADVIRDMLHLLYDTVLNDDDAGEHINVMLPDFSVSTLKQVIEMFDTRVTNNQQALAAHKTSSDHDDRYYTEDEVDVQRTAHSQGGDHDHRYYTETEINTMLNTHKGGTDHDDRYYTKSEADTQGADHNISSDHDNRYYTKSEADATLNEHITSDDHDGRYYTKDQATTQLTNHKQSADHDTRYYSKVSTDHKFNLHNTSGDHDGRYYTEAEINQQREAHKLSSDHDGRYYTEAEINSQRESHKNSSDHDGRYHSKALLSGPNGAKNIGITRFNSSPSNVQDTLEYLKNEINQLVVNDHFVPDGSITKRKLADDVIDPTETTIEETADIITLPDYATASDLV